MDEADFINVIVETNAKCYFKSERERRREIKMRFAGRTLRCEHGNIVRAEAMQNHL